MLDRRSLLIAGAGLPAALALPSSMRAETPDVAAIPFSWDRVPEFTLATKSSGPFDDAEIDQLANRFSLVTIGNSHAPRTYGGTEIAAVEEAHRIKAVNRRARVLLYWNSFIDYPTYAVTRTPKPESWYLQAERGGRYLPSNGFNRFGRWDLSNPEMRAWWISVVVDTLSRGPLDGVFIDAVPQVASRPDTMAAAVGATKALALVAGLATMLRDLRKAIGPNKTVLYNGLRFVPNGWHDGGLSFLRHASGAMIEHFDFRESGTPERLAADLGLMIDAGKLDKAVVLKTWPGFSWLDQEAKAPTAELHAKADAALPFRLAAFLIAAGDHSYFSYSWGYRENHGTFDRHKMLDHPLGRPLGPAKRDGMRYRRFFQHATVELDLATRTGAIGRTRSTD